MRLVGEMEKKACQLYPEHAKARSILLRAFACSGHQVDSGRENQGLLHPSFFDLLVFRPGGPTAISPLPSGWIFIDLYPSVLYALDHLATSLSPVPSLAMNRSVRGLYLIYRHPWPTMHFYCSSHGLAMVHNFPYLH